MRKIKFRAWDKVTNEMVSWDDDLHKTDREINIKGNCILANIYNAAPHEPDYTTDRVGFQSPRSARPKSGKKGRFSMLRRRFTGILPLFPTSRGRPTRKSERDEPFRARLDNVDWPWNAGVSMQRPSGA